MVKYRRSKFNKSCLDKFRDKSDLYYYMGNNSVSAFAVLTKQ